MVSGIVELDDFYFGSADEDRKRGHRTDKTNIMVAISKDKNGRPQFLKMQVIGNLKGETVCAFAEENITKGSTIQSDGYRSYQKPLAENYDHQYETYDSDMNMLRFLDRHLSW